MEKAISTIMQRIVSPVHMDDTVEAVEGVMKSHHISATPVYGDGGAILGIVTATDLIDFHAAGRDGKAVKAWEVCTYKPLQVAPDTPVSKVAELMLEHKVHHVIVMDRLSMEGIVSSLDFVKLYLEQCGNRQGG